MFTFLFVVFRNELVDFCLLAGRQSVYQFNIHSVLSDIC